MRPRLISAGSAAMTISLTTLCSLITLCSLVSSAAGVDHTHAKSDSTLAREIDVALGDLPAGVTWASSSQTPNTAAQTKQAEQAVVCIQKSGAVTQSISPDPFGTSERTGGPVVADVESPLFAKQNSTVALPTVSSDVTFMKTTAQASTDLAAFATNAGLACISTLIGTLTAAAVGHQIGMTNSFIQIPRHGTGIGGVGLRFAITDAGLNGTLYDDAFFYAQGTAEVSLSFVNIDSHVSTTWEASIAAKVMARAQHLVG
jgi:hypothetical protein